MSANKMSPSEAYVCWLDVMGTKSSMSESFEKSANFILRFHAAVLKAKAPNVVIYPVMDGVYISTGLLSEMAAALNRIMTCLAELFLSESNEHRFVVRGAIAKGPLQQGCLLDDDVCPEITANAGYKDKLLFGMPMIQACSSETCAPPFGIYIHESARTVGGLQGRYFFWQRDTVVSKKEDLQGELKIELGSFFDWEKARHYYFNLAPTKFDEYHERVNEYYDMIQANAAK